jgi:hypothetical protein
LETSSFPPELIAFPIVVLLVYQFGLRYVLTYRLTDEDVRAVLFGVVPLSVRRYQFITEVYTASFLEMQFVLTWRVTNRFTGPGVVIFSRGSSLFFKAVLYTPDDPEGFARELRRRVFQQTGRLPLGA